MPSLESPYQTDTGFRSSVTSAERHPSCIPQLLVAQGGATPMAVTTSWSPQPQSNGSATQSISNLNVPSMLQSFQFGDNSPLQLMIGKIILINPENGIVVGNPNGCIHAEVGSDTLRAISTHDTVLVLKDHAAGDDQEATAHMGRMSSTPSSALTSHRRHGGQRGCLASSDDERGRHSMVSNMPPACGFGAESREELHHEKELISITARDLTSKRDRCDDRARHSIRSRKLSYAPMLDDDSGSESLVDIISVRPARAPRQSELDDQKYRSRTNRSRGSESRLQSAEHLIRILSGSSATPRTETSSGRLRSTVSIPGHYDDPLRERQSRHTRDRMYSASPMPSTFSTARTTTEHRHITENGRLSSISLVNGGGTTIQKNNPLQQIFSTTTSKVSESLNSTTERRERRERRDDTNDSGTARRHKEKLSSSKPVTGDKRSKVGTPFMTKVVQPAPPSLPPPPAPHATPASTTTNSHTTMSTPMVAGIQTPPTSLSHLSHPPPYTSSSLTSPPTFTSSGSHTTSKQLAMPSIPYSLGQVHTTNDISRRSYLPMSPQITRRPPASSYVGQTRHDLPAQDYQQRTPYRRMG